MCHHDADYICCRIGWTTWHRGPGRQMLNSDHVCESRHAIMNATSEILAVLHKGCGTWILSCSQTRTLKPRCGIPSRRIPGRLPPVSLTPRGLRATKPALRFGNSVQSAKRDDTQMWLRDRAQTRVECRYEHSLRSGVKMGDFAGYVRFGKRHREKARD